MSHPALKKSIATVSLSGTLLEKLEAAAAVGFDGVEIFENDLLTFDGPPADVRQIAADLGLEITLYQPFRDFEAMPDQLRQRNLDRAERKFDVMEQLGASLILVCSNVQELALNDDERAATDLHEMAQRAAARGFRVGYEALAWGRHVNRWRHAWKIVQQANHPSLGLILDSFHTLAVGDDLQGVEQVPDEKIFFVQWADAPNMSMDVLSWSRHYRNFPGQGELRVADFTRSVVHAGYRGPMSLEVFNDEFRAAPARPTAQDGLRSLIWLEAEAGLAPLPPAPQLQGLEFLEFAVDYKTGRELAGQLRSLGFTHMGRHRSKAVELYRQGQVNLILNSEPDTAAAEHFEMHGPSVCAMAFRVSDAEQAIARAKALLCREWQERTGPNERQIQALRAPNGMLYYLVEDSPSGRSIYEDDFLLERDAAPGAGVEAIDHVAQALPAHQMDSFVLFYRSVLGLTPEPLHEIPDPYGLVRSRAMVSGDQRVRLPLNVSESGRTATGRFVSAYAGAGVHHIALRTGDIACTMSTLKPDAARILRIPDNYYDDVAARLGLNDKLLEDLRQMQVMYDQDPAGSFVHAYTNTFYDRFFFEIVQRDGYRGFGVPNASFRMAAQALSATYHR